MLSTNRLSAHLARCPGGIPYLTQATLATVRITESSTLTSEVIQTLVSWISNNGRPFRIVNYTGVSTVSPAPPPSSAVVRGTTGSNESGMRCDLPGRIYIAVNAWTVLNGTEVAGFVLFGRDRKNQLVELPLDFVQLTESYIAEYLAETVFRRVTEYSLKDCLASICSDNASAMAKSMELLGEKDLAFFKGVPSWICCFAHSVDLVTKAILCVFSVSKVEAHANVDDNYEPSIDEVVQMFFKQQQSHTDHDIRSVNDLSDKWFEALLQRLDNKRDKDDDLSHLKLREELVTDMYNSLKACGTLLKFQLLGTQLRYSGIARCALAERAKRLSFNAKHVPTPLPRT
ncbi:hypothetical protein JCM3770_003625 [Rhodotorula araucariae]